jgi:SpoIID/LytB domain protein
VDPGELIVSRRFVCFFAMLAFVLAPAASPAQQTDSSGLPQDGTIYIRGHGWGHGRGMGQWGARGMAAQGQTAADIITHFYSGVSVTTRAPEQLLVLVAGGPSSVVTSDAPFTVRWQSGSPIAAGGSDVPYVRVTPTASGTRVEGAPAPAGPWTLLGDGTQPVAFAPGSKTLQVVSDSGSRRYYRGSLLTVRTSPTRVVTINDVNVDYYLYGVVPREMPTSWPAEALNAQAIAARTYALNKKDRARAAKRLYDICATSSCQAYGGAARRTSTGQFVPLENSATTEAVKATAGQIASINGAPVFAEFSSSSGGYSAPGDTPYLAPVPDPGDSISPHHNWVARVKVADIEAKWPAIGRLLSVKVTKRNGFGEWGGRVKEMQLTGTSSTVTVSGNTFRSAFSWPTRPDGLRSYWFLPYYWDANLERAPAQVSVPAGGTVPVEIALRNIGNISWKIGSYVRIRAGSTRFRDEGWVAPNRPATIAANETDPAATNVRRGQVAVFRFLLRANGVAPGVYQETFSPVADGYSTMRPTITITVTVAPV